MLFFLDSPPELRWSLEFRREPSADEVRLSRFSGFVASSMNALNSCGAISGCSLAGSQKRSGLISSVAGSLGPFMLLGVLLSGLAEGGWMAVD
jgi:hypothetical protein